MFITKSIEGRQSESFTIASKLAWCEKWSEIIKANYLIIIIGKIIFDWSEIKNRVIKNTINERNWINLRLVLKLDERIFPKIRGIWIVVCKLQNWNKRIEIKDLLIGWRDWWNGAW
jgi:hypothetical protein